MSVLDPIGDRIRSEVESIKTELRTELRVAVETAILRETARMALSRLLTLDHDRALSYDSALAAIGEGE